MAQARRRMVFEELFFALLRLQQLKERRKVDLALTLPRMDWIRSLKPCRLRRPVHSGVRIMEIAADYCFRTADEAQLVQVMSARARQW